LRSVIRAFIPDFNSIDYAVVTSKIDVPRGASRVNLLTHLNLFAGAVVVMNDDVAELDRGKIDLKLKGVESPIGLSDFDFVVIGWPIDVGLAEKDPTSRRGYAGQAQRKQECEKNNLGFSYSHCSQDPFQKKILRGTILSCVERGKRGTRRKYADLVRPFIGLLSFASFNVYLQVGRTKQCRLQML
jgi:hypothetical protein